MQRQSEVENETKSTEKVAPEILEAIQNQDSGRKLCRFFVLNNSCTFGRECTFSHTLPPGGIDEARKSIPCTYYKRGLCKYGEFCMFRHDEKDLTEEDNGAAPLTCGICLEDVIGSGKRFGLLKCTHCYCIDCLRSWRKSNQSGATLPCPACRKPSDFLIPSKTFCVGEEKMRIVAAYKNNLASKPCKHFNGIGTCPFGRDCIYAHLDSDGEDIKHLDRKMKPRRIRRDDMEYLPSALLEFLLLEFYGLFATDDDDIGDSDEEID